MTESKREKRTRVKKVTITGMSVSVNGKIYGSAAMVTVYDTSLPLPNKEKVQEVCAEAYMKLLRLFTENGGSSSKAKSPNKTPVFLKKELENTEEKYPDMEA